MAAITVYCASSPRLDPQFHDTAQQVGDILGRRGVTLVYGGGSLGLMGEVAAAARARGARVIGIITKHLVDRERADPECDELVVVETMQQRKRLLADYGDGFVVLPGGIGTYEEFFEILVARKLDEHDKPIGVVNCHGYYNPLIAMIEHGIEHAFIEDQFHDLAFVHPDAEVVLEHVLGEGTRARRHGGVGSDAGV